MATLTLNQATKASKRRYRYVMMLLLIVCDIVAVNLGFWLSYFWHRADILREFQPPTALQIWWAFMALNVVFAMTFWFSGMYRLQRGLSRVDEVYSIFRAVSIGTLVIIALNTLFPLINVTNRTLVVGWILVIVLGSVLRIIYHTFIRWLRTNGYDSRRVLIIGAGEIGQLIYQQMKKTPHLGYQIVGFLSNQQTTGHLVIDKVPVLGQRNKLAQVVLKNRIDEIVIALSGASYNEVFEFISEVEDDNIAIKIYPDAFQLITNNNISVGELNGLPLITLRSVPLDKQFNRMLKRGLDIAVSGAALVFLSPLLLLIGALVRLDSPGPIFFIQERVGRDGQPFKMIKFRSMRADAEEHGSWTRPDDDRKTKFGTFLRRFSIDELPQFINVLLGDMSVVGPRPEQPQYVVKFSEEIPRYMHRHREKAGITGWAQVNGLRGDTSIEDRTRYDLYYIENWSPIFDIKIIIRTAYNAIRGDENAY